MWSYEYVTVRLTILELFSWAVCVTTGGVSGARASALICSRKCFITSLSKDTLEHDQASSSLDRFSLKLISLSLSACARFHICRSPKAEGN